MPEELEFNDIKHVTEKTEKPIMKLSNYAMNYVQWNNYNPNIVQKIKDF